MALLVDARQAHILDLRGARLLKGGAGLMPSARVGTFILGSEDVLAAAKGEFGGMRRRGAAAKEVNRRDAKVD